MLKKEDTMGQTTANLYNTPTAIDFKNKYTGFLPKIEPVREKRDYHYNPIMSCFSKNRIDLTRASQRNKEVAWEYKLSPATERRHSSRPEKRERTPLLSLTFRRHKKTRTPEEEEERKEQRQILIFLGVLGSIVIAGGVGGAALFVHKTGGNAGTGFVLGSILTSLVIAMSASMNDM